ncbi:6-bladed beta-propeller [Parabacteroides sp. AM08-6]|uniref:6-bladed beta-propeller n=1 Tax=Parabacteroides sp. AM08-6 TaxID=2292053 RepID=UPI000EFF684C|nr:6-bladed beta-propeller [Parabacteroides sp. AM08-6]RHJ80589.1 6-bladed beta-propeller [Parabacteroides sp. AM08-6]
MKTTSKQTRMGMLYMIGGFFFMLLFLAFSHPLMGQTSKPIVIEKDKTYEQKHIFLQDVATKIEYLPLETTDNGLLASLNFLEDIRIIGDHIFILIKGQFYHFDRSGHFLNSFNPHGQGPEEITLSSSFVIDEEKGQVGIMDMQTSSIAYYTFGGDFVKKEKLPHRTHYVTNLEDVLICRNTDSHIDPSLYIYSKDRKITMLSGTRQQSGAAYRITTSNVPRINKGEVFFNSTFTDTIFAVNTTSKRPAYIFLPPNNGRTTREDEKAASPILRFETESWANILLYGKNARQPKSYMVDKKNDRIYLGYLVNADTRMVISTFNTGQDNQIISIYEMGSLKDLLDKGFLSGKLKEVTEKASLEDNPVLLIATF